MQIGFVDLFVEIVGSDPIIQGLVGGLVIAFLNLMGASLVLIWRNPTEKWLDVALGFAAGVMLSASFTSLLLPGIEFASAPEYRGLSIGEFELAGLVPVLVGFFIGTFALDRGEHWVKYVGPLISTQFVGRDTRSNDGDEDHNPGHTRITSSTHIAGGMGNTRVRSVLFFTVAITTSAVAGQTPDRNCPTDSQCSDFDGPSRGRQFPFSRLLVVGRELSRSPESPSNPRIQPSTKPCDTSRIASQTQPPK